MRFLRVFFISLGVTFEVVRREKADENQLLPTERTDEQPANEVEVFVTTPTTSLAQDSLLPAVIVFHFFLDLSQTSCMSSPPRGSRRVSFEMNE